MALKMRVRGNTRARSRRIASELQKLPSEAHDKFRSVTPIRTGNARKRTRLQGSTIKANYAYAERLDDGYSKQAPKGMVKPTFDFIVKRVQQIVRGTR